jgi:hypothetical protein
MGFGCVESIYKGVIHCVFDLIPNLQNCFERGGAGHRTDKHLPQNLFIGQFLRKDDLLGLVSLFGPWLGP